MDDRYKIYHVLLVLVHSLNVIDDDTEQVLPQLFVVTLEQLHEKWKNTTSN